MRKVDFLEILRDYLSKGMCEERVEKIIGDYEEYFKNCIRDGLSERQAVATLGSPKGIAEEFLSDSECSICENINKTPVFIKIRDKFHQKLNNLRNNKSVNQLKLFNSLFSTVTVILSLLTLFSVLIIGFCLVLETCSLILNTIGYVSTLNYNLIGNTLLGSFLVGTVCFTVLVYYTYIKMITIIHSVIEFCIKVIIDNKECINLKLDNTNIADNLN